MSDPKFLLERVAYTYDDQVQALRGIDLAILPNRITAVFGPAESGKSTLLRLLNRLNDLVHGGRMEGQVLLDGEDIYAPGIDVTALRRRVGMVFATAIPLPMSIHQNMTYGPELAGLRDPQWLQQRIEESLKAAALWNEVKDRLHDPANDLSGGQKQRLCLARTLMLEPEVILLDAPTSGLDPISTAKVEESLQKLKQAYTIVIVPHSVQQAARVADDAVFILQGELVEQGPGETLFTRPQDKRTEDYVTGRFG